MVRKLLIGCFLLVTGCWVTGPEVNQKIGGQDTDTDTDSGLDALEIVSVSPVMGSNGGGTVVEIETTPLAADLEVLFGDRVAQVLEVTGSRIKVTVPPSDAVGWTDISVRSGGIEAVDTEAFYLWEDGKGQIGALGVFQYVYEYDRVGINDEIEVSADFAFFEPTDFKGYQFWAQNLDQCIRNYSPDTSSLRTIDTGANQAVLQTGVKSVAINSTSTSNWYEAELAEADFVSNSQYDLRSMNGADNWPSAQVDGFVQTPPGEMIVTRPNLGSVTAAINRTVDLRWDNSDTGDFVLVYIGRYEGDALKEEVSCVLRDDGAYLISSSMFAGWSTLSQAYFAIGRAKVSNAMLPHNNSQSEVLGIRWSAGWVFQN